MSYALRELLAERDFERSYRPRHSLVRRTRGRPQRYVWSESGSRVIATSRWGQEANRLTYARNTLRRNAQFRNAVYRYSGRMRYRLANRRMWQRVIDANAATGNDEAVLNRMVSRPVGEQPRGPDGPRGQRNGLGPPYFVQNDESYAPGTSAFVDAISAVPYYFMGADALGQFAAHMAFMRGLQLPDPYTRYHYVYDFVDPVPETVNSVPGKFYYGGSVGDKVTPIEPKFWMGSSPSRIESTFKYGGPLGTGYSFGNLLWATPFGVAFGRALGLPWDTEQPRDYYIHRKVVRVPQVYGRGGSLSLGPAIAYNDFG